jgi:O-antigen/teichoic acid export membrane protein
VNPQSEMDSKIKPTLTQSALTALKWNYVGAAARTGSGLIIGVILSRLLGPTPYGQVAVAMLVISLGNLLADVGLGSALIQKQDVSEHDVRFSFTVQLLFASALTLTGWALTPFIAEFFRQSAAIAVIRALLWMFMFQALGQTSTSLLRRQLKLEVIQKAQVISYISGFLLVGIPLATLGAGVWSLVAAQLVQSLCCSVITYSAVRHPLRPTLARHSPGMMKYGAKAMMSNIASWAIGSLDNLFVGRSFGVTDLGLYNRAFTSVSVPAYSVVSAVQSVLFPTYSRGQEKPESMRRGYLASCAIVFLVVLPPCLTIACIATTFVSGLYGPRWLAAAAVLVPLSLAMPFDSLMALSSPVIWAKNKVERELRVHAATAVIAVLVLAVASRVSVVAVGWAILGVYLCRWTFLSLAATRLLGVRPLEVARALLPAVLVATATAISIFALDHLLTSLGLSVVVVLIVDITCAALVYLASLKLFARFLTSESRWILDSITAATPRLARPIRWMFSNGMEVAQGVPVTVDVQQ